MSEEIKFSYNNPPEDIDLATGLCLLTYSDRYVIVPPEVWRNHGYKILNWFDNLYNNEVTYLKHSTNDPVTLVLPEPVTEKINIEEFLVWVKLTYA